MPRYINSADALHTLKHLAYESALNQTDRYAADVFEDIAKNRLETWVNLIPTADVVKAKHGKWERHYSRPNVFADLYWHCSACGYKNDNQWANVYHLYCPNCGSRNIPERSEDERSD